MIYDVRSRWFAQFLSRKAPLASGITYMSSTSTVSNKPIVAIGPTGSA